MTYTPSRYGEEYDRAMAYMRRRRELETLRKAELLRRAFAGGLVDHNRPARWRKDELAAIVLEQEDARGQFDWHSYAARDAAERHQREKDKAQD